MEHACNVFFFHLFIHSLFIEHLLCATHSQTLSSWSCPFRGHSESLPKLNPNSAEFLPAGFLLPLDLSGIYRSSEIRNQ